MKTLRSLGGSILFVLSGFLVLTAFPLGIWLLFHFQTVIGLLLALLGLVAPLFGLSLYFFLKQEHKSRLCFSFIFGTATLILVAVIIIAAPSGKPASTSPIQHLYSRPGRFYRLSPLNLIPEMEQMNVGINVVGPADPFIDRVKADRLSDLTLSIYREMEADPHFAPLGSVMTYPLREAFGLPFDNGHYFLHVPSTLDRAELAPAIVFLHGAGGPFKAYQWVWQRFAEEQGYIIISPTFGFGNWWEDGGTEAVVRALDHAANEVEIDQNQIWLAGLSNGGYGTIYSGMAVPDRFQGLILFSPGLPSIELVEPDGPFNSVWRDRPVLLISGEDDRRMPLAYVEQHVEFMQNGGVDLSVKLYPAEDHFLFFSQPDEIMQDVAQWIEANN